ncbi:hypothetical protein FG167_11875 [Lacinutrix sp. WUR7]|uniref:hypothetical protein n=1 Tax=Lacinutrix sp. WUR7 TaxID=2653681 RepID=UPI00193EAA84|nr:hypothetical protein [Lacinutrix sp. WUR7]QRM89899.1 hypothetical protein FG167_11875 [Lacinutrix sp. WUR7]
MKHNHLHNKKETGFKVPKDYFENFEASIIRQANLKDKATETGFTVPKDYFKNIENDILTKVNQEDTVKVIPLFSKRNLIYISSLAAAILLLFNLSILSTPFNFDSLETETVDTYILNNFEADEIASLFSSTELSETNFIDYNLNDETLDYYLESLDETELILE